MWKEREICEIIRIIGFCEIDCLMLIWKGYGYVISIEYRIVIMSMLLE